MCGLTGFWALKGAPRNAARATAQRMADTLVHRGPDDAGVWADEGAGLALAHRQLAILDLSLAGHQPMVSRSGRYVIAFNGEIYNYLELRETLTSPSPRGGGELPSPPATLSEGEGRSVVMSALFGTERRGG